MMFDKALLLSLFGGAIFGCAIPPCRISPLAWVGVAPLLIANTQHLRWEQRVLCALVWSIASAVPPIMMSIIIAKRQGAEYPNDFASWLVAFQPFLLLALVVGFVAAIAGKMWADGRLTGWQWLLGVTALGIVAEWLSFRLPLPIHLALTQSQNGAIVQWSSVGGIWLVSAFVWFCNATIALTFLSARPLFAIGAIAIAVLAHWLGISLHYRLGMALLSSKAMPIALVQNMMDDPLMMAQSVKNAQLIIVPELSLGQETDLMRHALSMTAQRTDAFIVAGFEETDPAYNAAALVSPDGKEVLRHRKVHLFGAERWRYRRGNENKVVETPFGKVGLAICFDTAFPDVVRNLARQGAKLIIVPNFDPPIVGYLLHHLHAAFFPFRVAENHVAIIKADGTGLSQVFNPDGSVVAEAPLGQTTVLQAEVLPGKSETLYTRWGNWFVIVCALTLLAIFTCICLPSLRSLIEI